MNRWESHHSQAPVEVPAPKRLEGLEPPPVASNRFTPPIPPKRKKEGTSTLTTNYGFSNGFLFHITQSLLSTNKVLATQETANVKTVETASGISPSAQLAQTKWLTFQWTWEMLDWQERKVQHDIQMLSTNSYQFRSKNQHGVWNILAMPGLHQFVQK